MIFNICDGKVLQLIQVALTAFTTAKLLDNDNINIRVYAIVLIKNNKYR